MTETDATERAGAGRGPGRNWAGNLSYSARRLVRPTSVDELRSILGEPGPVRALGSRHSFNDLADTDGTLIATDGLPVEFAEVAGDDGSTVAVRVAGGVRYGELAPLLHERGLALANLASLPHISVAGAVATGTHGSGDGIGSLASAVRALTLVTADGEIVTLRRGDADFAGAVVSLGALGVVVSLELDVEPSYEVAQTVFDGPRWDAILADLDAVTALGTSVSIFTTWQNADVADQLWVKQRMPRATAARPLADPAADEDAPVDETLVAMIASAAAGAEALGATAAAGPRHPIPGAGTEACTTQLGVPGPWFERLPHFRLEFTPSAGDELQSEYLVPRADAVAAIEAVRRLAPRIAPLLQVCEVRTVRADDLWLSMAYGVDVVALHFTWVADQPAVEALLPDLEAALPATARPHWGKLFALSAGDLAARYPRWHDFRALRARLDPDRRFTNPFLARVGL
ncbi:FAD-binding protein [Agromyces intestinalis]|uniref:FAD-binding protein n=1 Tax=Agromyces intestinalis TaxID=2592652 RepID=A0A5C1YCA8_9MICO|nr:D-arabinono-1,4-lactone oxidase [Agromyces intestinalis]QEO13723.1 FAD-binding protein [Agromyces intestinalis]